MTVDTVVKGKKMALLQVAETSGVDHPAHLHEGWAVMKQANPTEAKAVFAAIGKRENMTGAKTAPTTPAAKALTADDLASAVEKAIDSKLQPILDKIGEGWQELRQYGESVSGDTPTGAEAAPAAAAAPAAPAVAAAAGDMDALVKSLGDDASPALVSFIKSAQTQVEAAAAVAKAAETRATEAEKVAKAERDERLDAEAVTKAATEWGNLSLPEDVVKGIRRLGEQNPDLHKSMVEALTATNAQAGQLPITKELGTGASVQTGPAASEAETLAKSLHESGQFDTIQKARAHVFETRPELAEAIREGK